MTNAVFGKTMENVKNGIDFKLAEDDNKVRKLQTKLQFKDSKAIDGLHLIELLRKEVVCDKPICVGSSILDISKVCVMSFHYNVIHYRNLKFLVDLGVEVRAVHKVLTFEQKPWLKPHIDFNTDKRKEAKTEFEKEILSL